MLRFRSLPVLAVRRMAGNWRLLTSVVIGTIVAAAIISATAIYSDAIRDLGLRFALEQREPTALDVRITQSNIPVGAASYGSSRTRTDRALNAALGPATSGLVRQGRSATFFPAPQGQRPNLQDSGRDRANIYFRSEIDEHTAIVSGVAPPVAVDAGGGPIPVAIGAATAALKGIALGDRLDLYPFWDEQSPPLPVEIVGFIRALDTDERYWGGEPDVVDARARSWDTLNLLIPEGTFFGAMVQYIPSASGDFTSIYGVVNEALNSRNALPIARNIGRLESVLSSTETRARVSTELSDVLITYDQKLFFTRIPLLVLLLQIAGIVAYYLVMVSTMLVERQAAEIATLRSRGATTGQLLIQYGVEGGILAVVAAAIGPPLAAAVISALGPTPAFSALSGGGALDVHISRVSYLLAVAGALIGFAALMIPAWRATRTTMVEFKRATARPRPTPLFLRYYLDVALVLLVALVFWRLSQEEQLFTESLFGDQRADPFLLATPAVFMLTVGIVFLRLFPLVLRGFAWVLGLTKSVAVLVGMRSLVRNPSHYTRLILLLMFATGIGMFGATFSATLDRSYADRAAFAVGADVRAAGLRSLGDVGDDAFIAAIDAIPADEASPVVRANGRIVSSELIGLDVIGIEPESFGRVGYFRDDFAAEPLSQILATLGPSNTRIEGIPVPPDARQFGVWLKFPDIRGPVSIVLDLRDESGRTANIGIGFARPGDVSTEEWRFFAADLEQPVTRFGSPTRGGALTPPLTLHGIYLWSSSRIALQRGNFMVGPAFTTTAAPIAGAEPDSPVVESTAPFAGATFLHDFAVPAFEVIPDLTGGALPDSARMQTTDTPPGAGGALSYAWTDVARSPQIRGLRTTTPVEPLQIWLGREAANGLGIATGRFVTLAISGRFLPGQIAGVIELFPTHDPTRTGESFAIVNGNRLLTAANASPSESPLRYREAWFASSDPVATHEAIDEAIDAQSVTDAFTERFIQQQDPLVAAGWSGILAISFGAVLLLSAIGFVVYSYLTAQERSLEFAILRTLGFSRPQIFAQVVFEHFLVIAAGMGLGTLVGLQIGRYMMEFLATDERGLSVFPPFLLAVSWPEVFLVWGILGTVFVVTISAVVLLYFRLAVHRALRIGDV